MPETLEEQAARRDNVAAWVTGQTGGVSIQIDNLVPQTTEEAEAKRRESIAADIASFDASFYVGSGNNNNGNNTG